MIPKNEKLRFIIRDGAYPKLSNTINLRILSFLTKSCLPATAARQRVACGRLRDQPSNPAIMNHRDESLINDERNLYLTAVYKEYYKDIFLYAYRITGQQEMAKDLAQDAFVKLLTHKVQFDNKEGIKAFLLTAVRNACIDFIRHEKVVRRNESLLAEQWDKTSTEAEQERMHIELEVMRQLQAHIAALPEDKRLVAVKALLEGHSTRAVERLVGIKYHKIRYLKHQIISALQDWLRKKGHQD